MAGGAPTTANAMIRDVEARLRAVLARRDARLETALDAECVLNAAHLAEPLHVALLVLAEHVPEGGVMRIRATDLEGGDAEIVVTGLALPESFPANARHRDLWDLAEAFLASHHRARVAALDDRVLFLVPHGDRAATLRGRTA